MVFFLQSIVLFHRISFTLSTVVRSRLQEPSLTEIRQTIENLRTETGV